MKEGSNMTKKTKIVYVYLALFAFTLGFSFTLASRTQADSGNTCCIIPDCPGHPELYTRGHVSGGQCVTWPLTDCHEMTFECPFSGK
jgi:hypothetical protein